MGEKPNNRPPSVDKVVRALPEGVYSQRVRTHAARLAIDHFRSNGKSSFDDVVTFALAQAAHLDRPGPTPVVNMSGVILHTGLGRAALGSSATAVGSVAHHAAIEFDLETGDRGDRQSLVRNLLQELTGAEDALVVNNCAGAVFLTLRALCEGRDVVLSRGQMVEIGGSFRMPEIVKESGCRLVEVGCTNKTRVDDYASAVTDQTAAFLRCHPSNFRVVGFSEEPGAKELAEEAHRSGVLLIDDVGHGCLANLRKFGLPVERTLRESLADGADLVLASCDKLMGGPQAGVILGRRELVQRVAKHPLARALRVDKMTLAVLVSVLTAYADGKEGELPIWRYAGRDLERVKKDANVALAAAYPGTSVVEEGLTEMGGGSLPGSGIPTWRAGLKASSPMALMATLRRQERPVIGRIERDTVWLDPRTCVEEEVKYVVTVLKGLGDSA